MRYDRSIECHWFVGKVVCFFYIKEVADTTAGVRFRTRKELSMSTVASTTDKHIFSCIIPHLRNTNTKTFLLVRVIRTLTFRDRLIHISSRDDLCPMLHGSELSLITVYIIPQIYR